MPEFPKCRLAAIMDAREPMEKKKYTWLCFHPMNHGGKCGLRIWEMKTGHLQRNHSSAM